MSDAQQNDEEGKSRLISLAEAAEIYGFKPDYLRQLIHKDRLEAQKIGNSWATTPASVEKYLESRKHPGRPTQNTSS